MVDRYDFNSSVYRPIRWRPVRLATGSEGNDSMRQLTRAQPGSELLLEQMEGITALHSACVTLLRTPPSVIRSMNVMVALADFPLPASAVGDLAERIAGEYGLIASTKIGASHLIARLVRADSQSQS